MWGEDLRDYVGYWRCYWSDGEFYYIMSYGVWLCGCVENIEESLKGW